MRRRGKDNPSAVPCDTVEHTTEESSDMVEHTTEESSKKKHQFSISKLWVVIVLLCAVIIYGVLCPSDCRNIIPKDYYFNTEPDSLIVINVVDDVQLDLNQIITNISIVLLSTDSECKITTNHQNGTITFTSPHIGKFGFTYRIHTLYNGYYTAICEIVVTAVNEPPLAFNKTFTMFTDQTMIIDVTQNDTDPDGNLNFSSTTVVTHPTHINLINNFNGTLNCISTDVIGNHTFTYKVCDSYMACTTAQVTIKVVKRFHIGIIYYNIDDLSHYCGRTTIFAYFRNKFSNMVVTEQDILNDEDDVTFFVAYSSLKRFAKDTLIESLRSLQKEGIIVPVVVRWNDKGHLEPTPDVQICIDDICESVFDFICSTEKIPLDDHHQQEYDRLEKVIDMIDKRRTT